MIYLRDNIFFLRLMFSKQSFSPKFYPKFLRNNLTHLKALTPVVYDAWADSRG